MVFSVCVDSFGGPAFDAFLALYKGFLTYSVLVASVASLENGVRKTRILANFKYDVIASLDVSQQIYCCKHCRSLQTGRGIHVIC